MQYVIEFRNGSFFQNLTSERGGSRATAQRFNSAPAAEIFMSRHSWIMFNGGMVLPAEKVS